MEFLVQRSEKSNKGRGDTQVHGQMLALSGMDEANFPGRTEFL